MKIDQATISLEPSRLSNCIDMAIRFYGRHLTTILSFWLMVTIPVCGLIYELSARYEYDLRMVLLVLLFAILPLGTLLMSGAAPHAFGERFSLTAEGNHNAEQQFANTCSVLKVSAVLLGGLLLVINFDFEFARPLAEREMLRLGVLGILTGVLLFRALLEPIGLQRVNSDLIKVLWKGLIKNGIVGLGLVLCLYAGGWWIVLGFAAWGAACPVTIWFGFVPENTFLAELDRKLRSRTLRDLLKDESIELFFKGCWIAIFCGLLVFVMFFTIDLAASLLFRFPILSGRIGETLGSLESYANGFDYMEAFFSEMFFLLTGDPRVLTVLAATVLLVYPIGRLAWFFCYIDLRVRRDCWDIELRFVHEAERLEARI